MNVCRGLSSDAVVYSEFDGSVRECYPVTSGIVQGCPMSGWLSAVPADPILRLLVDAVGTTSDETLRAAVDDVGGALEARAASVPLCGRFQLVERAAGLRPRPHKCALVRMWASFSPALESEMRCWLLEVIPDWGRLNVVSAATHLAFVMGPEGGSRSWLGRWLSGAGAPPAGVSGAPCRRRCPALLRDCPSCPWICGAGPLPPAGSGGLRRAMGRALFLPGSTLGRLWHIVLANAGGGQFGSALAYVTAYRVRAGLDGAGFALWSTPTSCSQTLVTATPCRWWGSRPLALNLRGAAHADSSPTDVPIVSCPWSGAGRIGFRTVAPDSPGCRPMCFCALSPKCPAH